MSNERIVRIFAGAMVLLSLGLALWVSPYWLWLTALVGLNLFQSGITRFCLLDRILIRMRGQHMAAQGARR